MNPIPQALRINTVSPFPVPGEYCTAEYSAAWVADWLQSETFRAEMEAYGQFPPHALLCSESRSFLYHLIRCMQPELVVEIGTYMAGTAEILARALHQNGHGQLITIDPCGAERCPVILDQWHPALRGHVSFVPVNSMALAQSLGDQRAMVDIAFIDGCHEYEYALFDALALSRRMRPGGIMVFDNGEQAGVYRACKVFAAQNPDWEELGTVLHAPMSDQPFSSPLERASIPSTSFLVLRAPQFLSLGPGSYYASGQVKRQVGPLSGVCLDLLDPVAGTVAGEIYLRGFGSGFPLEYKRIVSARLDPSTHQGRVNLPFLEVLDIPASLRSSWNYKTLEISLFWAPEDGRSCLRMKNEPDVF